jgi:hypothetical protein
VSEFTIPDIHAGESTMRLQYITNNVDMPAEAATEILKAVEEILRLRWSVTCQRLDNPTLDRIINSWRSSSEKFYEIRDVLRGMEPGEGDSALEEIAEIVFPDSDSYGAHSG